MIASNSTRGRVQADIVKIGDGVRGDGRATLRAGRRGAQGRQEDPLRSARVARPVRRLPDRPASSRSTGTRRRHRQGGREPVDHRVRRARPLPAVHALGPMTRTRMSLFVASIGFGLITAAVLALAAVGFTLQFAVTNVLNLAYGWVMIVARTRPMRSTTPGSTCGSARSRGSPRARCCRCSSTLRLPPFQRPATSPVAMVIVALGMT